MMFSLGEQPVLKEGTIAGSNSGSGSSSFLLKKSRMASHASSSSASRSDPLSVGMAGLSGPHMTVGSKEPRLRADRPTVFSMRYDPWAHRVLLVAAKKRINVDVVNINTSAMPDWYLSKNPLGQVPCIQHGEFIALGSTNIVDYLEEKHPEPKLRAETPEGKAKDATLVQLFEKRIPVKFYEMLMVVKDPEDFRKTWSGLMEDFRWMEYVLKDRGSFLFGGRYVGTVDYNIYPWFERFLSMEKVGMIKMPWDKLPTLSTWMARMATDTGVQACRVRPEEMARVIDSYRQGKPNFDFSEGA